MFSSRHFRNTLLSQSQKESVAARGLFCSSLHVPSRGQCKGELRGHRAGDTTWCHSSKPVYDTRLQERTGVGRHLHEAFFHFSFSTALSAAFFLGGTEGGRLPLHAALNPFFCSTLLAFFLLLLFSIQKRWQVSHREVSLFCPTQHPLVCVICACQSLSLCVCACGCVRACRLFSGRVGVLVVALSQRRRRNVLGRAALVHAQQRPQQVVDVSFESLPLHPVLQQLVDLVAGGAAALCHTDVVVADADHSEKLVVDPHVQILVKQVEALFQGFFRAWGCGGKKYSQYGFTSSKMQLVTIKYLSKIRRIQKRRWIWTS